MIYYNTDNLWEILFRWQGSALNGPAPFRAFLLALFALVVAVANEKYHFVVSTRESTAFVDTLTVFNTFIGLTISFRMNSAFQQWRSGVVALGALSEHARGIVSSGCAYVSCVAPKGVSIGSGKKSDLKEDEEDQMRVQIPRDIMEKCTFFTELRRLVFLYIAIVFHDCRGRDGIDGMKDAAVLTESEYDELHACGSERPKKIVDKESFHAQRTPHKLRATVVELWLKRLVEVAAQRGHLSPVNGNMLQLKLAQLPTLYTTVFNIANVPIPFNYMQYLQFLIAAYMMLYTIVIVPRSQLYTPLWVFFGGMFLLTADQVAMEIECPFGLDANDIDLEARLIQIEEELTILVRSQYYFVSGGRLLPSQYTNRGQATSFQNITSSYQTTETTALLASQHAQPSFRHLPVQESFSFHQGRCEDEYKHPMSAQASLPEINEFTTLITQGTTKEVERYGSGRIVV